MNCQFETTNCRQCVKRQCAEVCTKPKYQIETRLQFTIKADADTICCILRAIAAEGINLNAQSICAIDPCKSVLRIVPGQDNCQADFVIKCVKSILTKFNVCFSIEEVVKVYILREHVPGVFAQLYCSLNECLVIYSSYSTEYGDIIFEVDSVAKAIRIISRLR